ncbi:MAG: S9 family peptidase [Candidatus Riflebacteria bacterium]|nr:S9 family peptidase [Candidatus Riflebacteria bacterium]
METYCSPGLDGINGQPETDAAGKTLQDFLQRVGKISNSWSPSFSPDGKTLAYISDSTGSPEIWTVSLAGGIPQRLTEKADPIGHVSWSPDGERLAFSLAPKGNCRNVQVFIIKPDGTKMEQLTEGDQGGNWFGPWASDSTFLPITSSSSDPSSMDSYVVDLASRSKRLVSKNKGFAIFSDITACGTKGILFEMECRGRSQIFLVDLTTGSKTLLTPQGSSSYFEEAKFFPDERSVILSSNHESEFKTLAKITLSSSGQPESFQTIVESAGGDLEDFAISRNAKIAALCWNVAGSTKLEFLNLETGDKSFGPSLPAEIACDPVFSDDGQSLALAISGSSTPRSIFLLDVKSETFLQVSHQDNQEISLDNFVRPELLNFLSHDNLPLSGWFYAPKGFKFPGPVVLSFHGGPEGQERPAFRSDYQALLANGFAIFAPNVRGSTGFGKKFTALDNGPLRFNAIKDIKTCYEYLVSEGLADPARVALLGASYGGYMVMAGLTHYPDLFSAGACLYGIMNFETYFERTDPAMAEISKEKFGDPVTQKELLRSLSPIHMVEKVRAPTLLLHGENDNNVPLHESKQMFQGLASNRVKTKLEVFSNEGHGFFLEENRIKSILAVVDWFRENL